LKPGTVYALSKKIVRRRRKEYRRLYKMSLRKWQIYHQKNIAFEKCHWMGVSAIKNPLDAWIYQEILFEVKPDFIVEIGSAEGGTTLYLAHLLDLLDKGLVISVDIDHSNFKPRHDRIITVTGDSAAPETVSEVFDHCRDGVVLVIHDGDHNRDQVLKNLNIYSALVSKGSYFIVEDGVVDLFRPGGSFGIYPHGGPLEAVEEFLKSSNQFVADRERERYLLTCNPHGFLKKSQLLQEG